MVKTQKRAKAAATRAHMTNPSCDANREKSGRRFAATRQDIAIARRSTRTPPGGQMPPGSPSVAATLGEHDRFEQLVRRRRRLVGARGVVVAHGDRRPVSGLPRV